MKPHHSQWKLDLMGFHQTHPNIYLTGELLDVDGDCGGYNLHFAFASGYHVAKTIINGKEGLDATNK